MNALATMSRFFLASKFFTSAKLAGHKRFGRAHGGVPATGTWIDWICLRTVKSSSDQPDGSVATEDTEATAATAATGDELL